MKQETEEKEYWDTIIEADKVKLSLSLAKLWKYKDLIIMFVKRDITVTYKQTVLGPAWFIIQPVLTTLVFTIFGIIMNASSGGTPHVLFYMSGIVVWGLFSTSLIKTSNTFLANVSLYEKVYFPRLTIPVSVVISNFISFCIQFAVFLLLLAYYIFFKSLSIHINPILLLLMPLLLLLTALMGLGIGILVSSLSAKFRDLTFLVAFAVQLAMFLSPVILPLSPKPSIGRTILLANPMSSVIEAVRYIFLNSGELNIYHLLYSTAFTAIVLITGLVLFNYKERTFLDTV